MAWSRELSSSPYAASPLIADIDADGQLDVAVASFTGDVHVVRGSDSQHIAGSYWPLRLADVSVHSSPLQVCKTSQARQSVCVICGSGMNDVVSSCHLCYLAFFFRQNNSDLISSQTGEVIDL